METTTRKALSLEALAKHQERIRGMVQKIEKYKPTFHLNKNYKGYDVVKRAEERERQSDQLFEQNLKLIHRLESTGPKIETKKFPEIKPNPQRIKSLSANRFTSSSGIKLKTKDVYRNEEEVMQENLRMITNIECTGPKIQCWTNRKMRNLNELIRMRKREEEKMIGQKYRDIAREMAKLANKKSNRRSPSLSPLHKSSRGSP